MSNAKNFSHIIQYENENITSTNFPYGLDSQIAPTEISLSSKNKTKENAHICAFHRPYVLI